MILSEEKPADPIVTTEIIESEDEFNDEKPPKSALEEFNISESCNGINFWNVLPDESVEKINVINVMNVKHTKYPQNVQKI